MLEYIERIKVRKIEKDDYWKISMVLRMPEGNPLTRTEVTSVRFAGQCLATREFGVCTWNDLGQQSFNSEWNDKDHICVYVKNQFIYTALILVLLKKNPKQTINFIGLNPLYLWMSWFSVRLPRLSVPELCHVCTCSKSTLELEGCTKWCQ